MARICFAVALALLIASLVFTAQDVLSLTLAGLSIGVTGSGICALLADRL